MYMHSFVPQKESDYYCTVASAPEQVKIKRYVDCLHEYKGRDRLLENTICARVDVTGPSPLTHEGFLDTLCEWVDKRARAELRKKYKSSDVVEVLTDMAYPITNPKEKGTLILHQLKCLRPCIGLNFKDNV